jgi:metacaspase-1
MATGMALTIGLNRVDSAHYDPDWDSRLSGCENDAQDMAQIAQSQGFEVDTLLTSNATRKKVMEGISKAASTLKTGDLFLLTYSGHGGQLPDQNNDEEDAQDDTWCLYDGELVDDELYAMWSTFAPGVRILVISDSCVSGTIIKDTINQPFRMLRASMGSTARIKSMPSAIASRTYRKNKTFYDPILKDARLEKDSNVIKATVILISACQENQDSYDGDYNSLFTGNLLRVWHHGKFKGTLKKFHQMIRKYMPPDQTPNYMTVGASNPAFESQIPFTI